MKNRVYPHALVDSSSGTVTRGAVHVRRGDIGDPRNLGNVIVTCKGKERFEPGRYNGLPL